MQQETNLTTSGEKIVTRYTADGEDILSPTKESSK